MDEQEWDVRDIVEAIPEIRSREFSSVKHKFPIITVRTYAIRRAGFFVWNVLAVMVGCWTPAVEVLVVVVVAPVEGFLVRMGVGIAVLEFDFGGMVIGVVGVDNDASL